jgi:deoxyribodipyrimidine photo-lyase
VVFEALRVGYEWASDRFHAFVIDGMKDHQEALKALNVTYVPYVERAEGEGKGLLKALSQRASVVVTDEYPCFFLPRMQASAATQLNVLGVPLERVDSCGISPLKASPRHFTTAASFRRHLQKTILPHMASESFPLDHPLAAALQDATQGAQDITNAQLEWSSLSAWPTLGDLNVELSSLPIDHSVTPCARGGARAASDRLEAFMERGLRRYHLHRNDVEGSAASGLSPYLHFGHISAHELVERALRSCEWHPGRVAPKPNGSREGWWRASAPVEAFLDELITWRELGFVFAHHNPTTYTHYDSLPSWALTTLAEHARDERPERYSFTELEEARTADEVWNAAQRQLVEEGVIHNYLRMLWGKKILEWSATPKEALERLIELNNKYALDGRDPNSYSGIFWCLGRFDRAWGPERPIFGKVRFMSSESTKRKLKLKGYLERYSERACKQRATPRLL